MNVRKLLKQMNTKTTDKTADDEEKQEQLQQALVECRRDLKELSHDASDEEKQFLENILTHHEKMFQVVANKQNNNSPKENADEDDPKNDEQQQKLLLAKMNQALQKVNPDSFSTMSENEKEKTMKNAKEAIDNVIQHVNENNNNKNEEAVGRDNFSPRDGDIITAGQQNQQPSSPVAAATINALTSLQDVVRESGKWFSDDLKKQSIRRMLSNNNLNYLL